VDPDDIYSPDAEDIRPHAIAFAQLMFAHSKFEREVRSLQAAITNDLSFGERRSHQWKARVPSVLATGVTSLLTVNGGASTLER
jgi:hypothetical protein